MSLGYDRARAVATIATADVDAAAVRAIAEPFPVEVLTPTELRNRIVRSDAAGRPEGVERVGSLIGSVTATPAGAEELAASRDLLQLFGGAMGLSDYRLDSHGEHGFGAWLCRRFAELSDAFLDDAAQMRRANAVLRREHDDMLERFSALERDYRAAAPPRLCKLDLPASDVDHPALRVDQRLPISPLGVGIIDLLIARTTRASGGALVIEAFAQGDPRPLQGWSLPASGLAPGWISLRAERAFSVTAMEMRLLIRWEGDAEAAPYLGLSTPVPLEEFAVSAADGGPPRPLALRVWGFAPGARLPAKGADALGQDAGGGQEEALSFGLSSAELRRSELLAPLGLDLGFDLVRYRSEANDVLVHPNATGATVAVIRDVPIPQAKAIKAIVRVDHSKARPVEFGLALTRSQPLHADPVAMIRRWTRVVHSVFAEAEGHVEATEGPYDLLLVARMADGADPDLAWATFKKVEVTA